MPTPYANDQGLQLIVNEMSSRRYCQQMKTSYYTIVVMIIIYYDGVMRIFHA